MGSVVSELYTDKDNPQSSIQAPAPPAPPSPIPTPVVAVQPVTTKPRMADEKPDGSIRDTSLEAFKPGNDLQFRKFDDDKESPAEPTKQEAAPATTQETPPAPPEPPKVYAGKFKSVEELEKAYQESQSAMTKAMQDRAEAEKKLTAPKPAEPTPEELAARKKSNEEFLQKFVENPQGVIQEFHDKAQQQAETVATSLKMQEDWRKANADIAPHEFYVAAEAFRLSQSDPELAKNPAALLSKATDNFRQVYGTIRTEGAREALTTETRVTPLLSNTAAAPATEQPQKAPLSFDEAFSATMSMLKAEEKRSHQGLRR